MYHVHVFVRHREVYPLLARANRGEKTCTWYNEQMREWLLGWVPHPGPAWQHRDRGDAEE